MSKRNPKKYTGWATLFKVKCVNPKGTAYLHEKWYNVIDETDTNYLIKFNSGAANWYSKDRFEGKYVPKNNY